MIQLKPSPTASADSPKLQSHSLVRRQPTPTKSMKQHATPTQVQPRALKLKEAGVYLGGISTITVRRLIQRGLLKPNLALRHIIIPIAELDRFLGGGHQ